VKELEKIRSEVETELKKYTAYDFNLYKDYKDYHSIDDILLDLCEWRGNSDYNDLSYDLFRDFTFKDLARQYHFKEIDDTKKDKYNLTDNQYIEGLEVAVYCRVYTEIYDFLEASADAHNCLSRAILLKNN
jgi:hypothetical protein